VRFVVITDLHLGPVPLNNGTSYIMGDRAHSVLRGIVSEVLSGSELDYVIQLGDLVHESAPPVDLGLDRSNLQLALTTLESTQRPIYHTIGNHDAVNLDLPDVLKILGLKSAYYTFESSGMHGIVLNSNPKNPGNPIVIDETQKTWLKETLQRLQGPVFVFLHHSLAEQELTGNFWFAGKPELCLVNNRKEIREIIESSGKVVAVFNGHLHWHNITYHNSIPYVTLRSCVDNFNLSGMPTCAYAYVELTSTHMLLDIRGKEARKLEIPFPRVAPGTKLSS